MRSTCLLCGLLPLAGVLVAPALAAEPGAVPTLALRARWDWEPDVGRSAAGFLTLTVPWSALFVPRKMLAQGPPAPVSPPPPPLAAEFVRATVRAALRAAGFDASTRRLDSLASRAKTSAALPDLRLRGGRATDTSLRLAPTADDPYRHTQSGGAELFLEVELTWRLQRLVFSEAELNVERLRRQRAQARARLVERVLALLFAWQRARVSLAAGTLDTEQQTAATLEQVQAEAALDVLTDGWFSARVGP